MKISNKISLSFLAIAIILTSAAETIFYIIAKDNLQKSINNNLFVTVASRTNHIETYLKMMESYVGQLSKSAVLEDFLKIKGKENPQQGEAFDIAMKRLVRTKEENPEIAEFLLLDTTGKVAVSSNESSVGSDESMDAFFLNGQKGTYIEDVYYSETEKEPLIAVSTPFLDSQTGELLGVLAARVKLNDLNNIVIEKTGLGDTEEIYIVNKSGFMITPSRFIEDAVLKQKVDTEQVRQAWLHKDKEHALPQDKTVSIFPDYRGVQVLGTHGFIPQMQWAVLGEIDTEEALAPLAKLYLIFFIILFLVPIAAWLFGTGITRTIVVSLEKLNKAAEIIGSGNLDYKASINTKDEVGQLSRAFDAMAKNLKNSVVSVESLNKEITERKNAEELLKRNELKYRTLLENLPQKIFLKDKNLVYISCNENYARDLKIKPEGIAGKTDYEFYSKKLAEKYRKDDKRIIKAGKIENIEEEYIVDGQEMFVHTVKVPVKDEKGNIAGVLGIFWDITEQKRIWEMLQESEKKFRSLFESSRDAIMTLEPPSWKFTSGNQATVEMFGARNAGEFSSLGPWNVSPERQPDGRDSAQKAKEMFEKAMREGFNFFEWTHKRLNGADFPATVLLTRMEQDGKKVLQATVRDISAQKKAEAAVLEEKNKLEKYLNVAGAIILFLSPEGKVLLINKRGCEILGYEPKDILNKDWFADFISEKDLVKAKAGFDGLIEGKADGIEYFESHVLTKNKNHMNIGWGSVVIKDALGKRQTVLSIGIDISELEQAKTTIGQLSEVNKLKDDFLNIATHELKTPLTTIIGLSEIMKEQNNSLNPENQKYINIINAEGRKLNHIIKRVLTVTRFESGREIIAKEKINLKELIFSFLPSLEVVANKKGLKITIDIKDKNINLISDKEKISEVIYNFIDNAVKHSSAGQTITISVSRFSPKFAKIEVIDLGEGIPKKLQSKLFAKFSQLDSSLSRSQEGTGLGLYICKLIAEKLGGEIGIKSALGKGSSFFFTLPIQNAATQKRDIDFKAV